MSIGVFELILILGLIGGFVVAGLLLALFLLRQSGSRSDRRAQ